MKPVQYYMLKQLEASLKKRCFPQLDIDRQLAIVSDVLYKESIRVQSKTHLTEEEWNEVQPLYYIKQVEDKFFVLFQWASSRIYEALTYQTVLKFARENNYTITFSLVDSS